MARRSRAATNPKIKVEELKSLLDNFLDRLDDSDLREQVRSLVPAVYCLRDLGSGLIPMEGKDAARDRILSYLQRYPKTLIDGDELMVVSGIGEWARRVRELRVQFGWTIYTGVTIKQLTSEQPEVIEALQADTGIDPDSIKPNHYILMREEQDREAALRWNQLNEIRKKPGGVKSKILEFLRANAGRVVTGEELRYLANNKKEWARRSRELRTEDGWPVVTRMQGRDDLGVGEYLLEEDKQAEEHDRHIKDDIRVNVLERDGFACTFCGWTREQRDREDPRKFLEIHHIVDHVKGGDNEAENLIALCNVHHDAVHRGDIVWSKDGWLDKRSGKKVLVSLS
ncbi:HNH endonuclease [Parvularcula flava]|uniref:HNH endonuclease n=1 Tax=Aquisalinus luteolus TaxID=1566827 RepID=A0A8J3ERV2_9PROT|nr:HNH endonuclease signature motif containing protein [Aquisalinus luteolus]NHK28909.1 HNH endonuclease [Aquisalinus luteolus]GGI00889.1 hypothetical protein GCM10011355_30250 [Aquisalinus luteolus]